ncbi:MAG: hypothetical protein CVT73_07085 [Alphaproteobacteria bacterium HGW-Alphaproteobacteria-12]|nr:MAG: hypothetical protein CVT73_07085 [Alphaproteobacteria bacterium HGW-Alphaproteobacteria-12]
MTTPARDDRKDRPLLARLLWGIDRPQNAMRLFYALAIVCVGLGLADFAYHKHTEFPIEQFPAIYGLFGFTVYVIVIFLAKGLRPIVRRREDYYEPFAIDTEDERAAGSDPDAKGGRPHA